MTVVTRDDRNRIGWADLSANRAEALSSSASWRPHRHRLRGDRARRRQHRRHGERPDRPALLLQRHHADARHRLLLPRAGDQRQCANGSGGSNSDPSPAVTVTSTPHGGNGMHAVYFDDRFFTGTTVVVENERAANMFGGGSVGFDGLDSGGGNGSPAGIGARPSPAPSRPNSSPSSPRPTPSSPPATTASPCGFGTPRPGSRSSTTTTSSAARRRFRVPGQRRNRQPRRRPPLHRGGSIYREYRRRRLPLRLAEPAHPAGGVPQRPAVQQRHAHRQAAERHRRRDRQRGGARQLH